MYKYIFLLLVISPTFLLSFGKNYSLDQRLSLADSLGQMAKYEQVQAHFDTILNELYQSKEIDIEFEQEVLQLKAFYLSDNNQNIEALHLVLGVIETTRKLELYQIEFLAHLTAELIYEKNEDYQESKRHLDFAKDIYLAYQLDSFYSNYCIRISSLYRLTDRIDSALYFAQEALEYSEIYAQKMINCEAHLLLGINLYTIEPFTAIEHYKIAANRFEEFEKHDAVAVMYNNISSIYKRQGLLKESFSYNDTAISIYHKYSIPLNYYLLGQRADLFAIDKKFDSAYYYQKKEFELFIEQSHDKSIVEIKKITEEFQNDKNQLLIQNQLDINKKQKMLLYLLSVLVTVCAVFIVLLFKWERKLNEKNKRIKIQSEQIQKSLKQKETLLQEVQHRIKNNLQIIIGLLEFQKGKHSNIKDKEITEENQNRIKAMAILQDKIYLSDNIDNVNLSLYLDEISNLLLNYYNNGNLYINIKSNYVFENVSIDKVNLIGLIVIELINNSYKHAFDNQNTNNIIDIQIDKIEDEKFNCLISYKDNGKGFKSKKKKSSGFGIEIIEGLVNQMNGKFYMEGKDGFLAKIELSL